MTKKTFKTPLVGRITKLRRALWTAHVPAIGAFTQGRSLLDAAQMLKRVIEMMLRLDGHKATVTVTAPKSAVSGVAAISVTCNRRGLLEARAAEFARLSAGVKGPITNPYFVAVRREGITVVHDVALRRREPRGMQKLKIPLVGRITKLKRTWWVAHLPAVGVLATATSLRGAVSTLKGNIERMFRKVGDQVTVAITVLKPAVEDGADISVTCDRHGLLEARAAEFKHLLADVDGPIRNPFLVPVRRGDFSVANNVDPRLPARPTNTQRIEHMRWRVALVAEATGRGRRMPPSGLLREATIHRLSIIGAAAASTPKAFRAKHPSVPWDEAISMREFFGKPDRLLDPAALRKAVRETVPALAKALARPDLEAAEALRQSCPRRSGRDPAGPRPRRASQR